LNASFYQTGICSDFVGGDAREESLKLVLINKRFGESLEVRPYRRERFEDLAVFYDLFEPKGEYQGIPPAKRGPRLRWLEEISSDWHNFLILDANRIIGHVAVTYSQGQLQELIVFMLEEYRGRGIGTEVLRHIRGWLWKKGTRRLWLTVHSTNTPAIRCFRKVGFGFSSPVLEPEREMIMELEKSR
jgi:RimJ/RimL family protein N-acetyltransferase